MQIEVLSDTTADQKQHFMDLAFRIAERVDPHHTAPNPRVGCVVVENGRVVSEGVHQKYGGHHAEVSAGLKFPNLVNCEVYLTLEPCDIFPGKQTPSCSSFLIQREPLKLYVASLDPKFGGKNLEKIKRAGIEVEVLNGFDNRAKQLNPFFDHTDRPYVCVKIAQTLDGKINLDDRSYAGGKNYISNDFSLRKVHELRAQYAAILTTTETVLKDNPQLNCRLNDFPEYLGPNDVEVRRTFPEVYSDPHVIILGDREVPREMRVFSSLDREVYMYDRGDLLETLEQCRQNNKINSLLVEAGPTLVAQLLERGLVDELMVFIAPQIVGKNQKALTTEFQLDDFDLVGQEDLRGDVMVRYVKK